MQEMLAEALEQLVPDLGGMPAPLSRTAIATASPSSRVATVSVGRTRRHHRRECAAWRHKNRC